MTDPEPPFTLEQIREKLKSGEFKIVSAEQDYVGQYAGEIHQLLLLVAPYMSDIDPEEWASHTFVSDQSQLGDFFSRHDADYAKSLVFLGVKLGFPVERQMYIYEIAARMRGVQ